MRKALLLAVVIGAIVAASAPAMTVRLASPENGATLRGGSLATLDWSAIALPREAEEWEAFLSVNGGEYYAFRITPHLDIDRRHVTWIVPNVDAIDARILIRAGDERDETGIELPVSFSIVRDASAGLPKPELAPEGSGEAAREGDRDVIAWAYGDRGGSRVTQQWGRADGGCRFSTSASTEQPEIIAMAPPPHTFIDRAPSMSSDTPRETPNPAIPQHRHSADILLVSSRLNI